MLRRGITATLLFCLCGLASDADAQSLRGSSSSLSLQNQQARAHDYTFLSTRSHVTRFVSMGLLERLEGNADYALHNVSHPYARPEVKTFIERLAVQYRSACGEQLVVTSLVRPESMRLWNSSSRSVHPTGMAIDLRKSRVSACRRWLENVLVQLEGQGVLEATEEHRPPHYHVALFPKPYFKYLAMLGDDPSRTTSRPTLAAAEPPAPSSSASAQVERVVAAATEPLAASFIPHRVLRGESLWRLAREFGTSVTTLMEVNGLQSEEIKAGQELKIPAASDAMILADATRTAALARPRTYKVGRGDSLWTIARRHDTTVDAIKSANGLRTSKIKPGQVLKLPVVAR